MPPNTEDRRQRRTRRVLRQALLSLLRDKDYAAITVQDIIDRAEVARSTYYAHYVDKLDLLVGRRGVFAGQMDEPPPDRPRRAPPAPDTLSARHWFHHLQAHRATLKTIEKNSALGTAMSTFARMVRDDLEQQTRARFGESPDGQLPLAVVVDYLTSTLMTLIGWWVAADMPRPPEEMDETFRALALPGLAAFLHPRG
jgi:AcrR family transcriptional regulator